MGRGPGDQTVGCASAFGALARDPSSKELEREMNIQEFGPIEVGEIKAVRFDFSTETAAVLSAPTVSVTVLSGTDPSPSSVLSGPATIVGLEIVQKITALVGGVTYRIRAEANDADGLHHGVSGEFSTEYA
jgi:hypothetical protein